MDTVFYSWQSDLNPKTNRFFIEKALEKAVKFVRKDGLKVDPRLEQDARSAPGTADIPAEILRGIEQCRVFVADVSIINRGAVQNAAGDLLDRLCQGVVPPLEELAASRPTPNPNVLTELGYAARCLGWGHVVLVFNEASGKIEDLPFDIRHRTIISYRVVADDEQETKKQKEELLKNLLKGLIGDGLRRTEEEIGEAARQEEKRLAEERARYPVLDLQFYDPETHKAIGKAAHIQSVFAHAPEAPPEEKEDESTAAHFARLGLSSQYHNLLATASHLSGINEKYREQMAHYILARGLFRPLSFVVENTGRVLATDVRVEIVMPKSEHIMISRGHEMPEG